MNEQLEELKQAVNVALLGVIQKAGLSLAEEGENGDGSFAYLGFQGVHVRIADV